MFNSRFLKNKSGRLILLIILINWQTGCISTVSTGTGGQETFPGGAAGAHHTGGPCFDLDNFRVMESGPYPQQTFPPYIFSTAPPYVEQTAVPYAEKTIEPYVAQTIAPYSS